MPEYYQNIEQAKDALETIVDPDYIGGVVAEQQEDLEILCSLFKMYLQTFEENKNTILERLVGIFRNDDIKKGNRPIDIFRNNTVKLKYNKDGKYEDLNISFLCKKEPAERVIIADKKKEFVNSLFTLFENMMNDRNSNLQEQARNIFLAKKDNSRMVDRMLSKLTNNEHLKQLGKELHADSSNIVKTKNGVTDMKGTIENLTKNEDLLKKASELVSKTNLLDDITPEVAGL